MSRDDRRDALVDVFVDLAHREGRKPTTSEIAQEAGVSLGSVTYHFATQQDLLRESLRHFVTEETKRFGDLAKENRTECADLDQVADIVGQVADATGSDSERIAPYELYLHAGRDPELRAAAAE